MFGVKKTYDAADLIFTYADSVDDKYPFLEVGVSSETEPLVTIRITAEFGLKMQWSRHVGLFTADAVERICVAALGHHDTVIRDAPYYRCNN